ncbi:MAG: single-stranded-DNA-specific exonuclease RecJ [Alphaproteobacteria bacterium]|nr:single-stranded-DNA-specific exonuclease RecJ [Alphaproteobacteria bacterium]
MDAAAFLGVQRSALGRFWRPRLADERAALALAQRLGVPEIVARILAGRGVDADAAPGFLEPRLRDALPDPFGFKDRDRAAKRLVAAIKDKETIAVFGDYDVDGATSSALLRGFFAAVGGESVVYIPDRMKEGYGPNALALLKLKADGAGVAVTVDCGTTAHAPLQAASDAGLDMIVVDHHAAEPQLPKAFAIVNPNRLDESGAHGQMAAVGVAFLLAVAVNRRLRDDGLKHLDNEGLLGLLDLVALGTVCDVVPLTGVNRAYVAQGLKAIAARARPGIAALADVAGLSETPQAFHLGFTLGPRVNAGGRVGEADLGTRLLTTQDPLEAAEIARKLDGYNRERQRIEAEVLESALTEAEAMGKSDFVCVAGEGWHAGVIGIVASRLKEKYDRPALVIALDGEIGKGSARSAMGFDIGAATIAARAEGLLINGGGHANAAGLTVARDALPALQRFLNARVAAYFSDAPRVSTYDLDGAMSLAGATTGFLDEIDKIGPFGMGNPEPRFAFANLRIAKADIVGTDHVRCFLQDARGARLAGIAFRSASSPLGTLLLRGDGAALHIAGRLKRDTWRGAQRVQLHIEDAAPA